MAESFLSRTERAVAQVAESVLGSRFRLFLSVFLVLVSVYVPTSEWQELEQDTFTNSVTARSIATTGRSHPAPEC